MNRTLTRAIFTLMLAALLSGGCDLMGGDSVTAPTSTPIVEIQGPQRLEVSERGQFSVTYRDGTGTAKTPALTTWTRRDEAVLRIDRFSGAATAIKEGTTTVQVAVESESRLQVVTVVPKVSSLFLDGLPPQMSVGAFADVALVAVADRGNGPENINVAQALGATLAAAIQWTSLTQTTLSVTDSVATAGLGVARALAPGTGRVQASVAGFTAEATTQIIGTVPGPTVPVSPLPPATTPADLNGSYGFDLRRTGADCGLGLRASVAGSFEVSGVPVSGRFGRARLNYGTIYDWVQLSVVLSGASDVLEFQSEGLLAPCASFEGSFRRP